MLDIICRSFCNLCMTGPVLKVKPLSHIHASLLNHRDDLSHTTVDFLFCIHAATPGGASPPFRTSIQIIQTNNRDRTTCTCRAETVIAQREVCATGRVSGKTRPPRTCCAFKYFTRVLRLGSVATFESVPCQTDTMSCFHVQHSSTCVCYMSLVV